MGLLSRLNAPVRGIWILRRVLAELRGIRRALDRQADALEFANGTQVQPSVAGQTFRSYAHVKQEMDDQDLKTLTEVSYVDETVLAAMLQKEDELRAILGRDPSEQEIMTAYEGREP